MSPIEIAVAVIWQVKDTAKAVFEVDNYKEYLSFNATPPFVTLSVFPLMMSLKILIQQVIVNLMMEV